MQKLTQQEQGLIAEIEQVLGQLKPGWKYDKFENKLLGISDETEETVLEVSGYTDTVQRLSFDSAATEQFILDARNRYVPQLLEIVKRLTGNGMPDYEIYRETNRYQDELRELALTQVRAIDEYNRSGKYTSKGLAELLNSQYNERERLGREYTANINVMLDKAKELRENSGIDE